MTEHLDEPTSPTAEGDPDGAGHRSNFIRDIIDADNASGKWGGRVVTRFPPEPNGYLHIGHAKSICLNFGLAADYGGRCNLRFDDTNPLTEETEYVEGIEADIRWLGFEWGETLHASDYFERMYECAETLVKKGLAYVDSLSQEEMSEYRGTITEPGRESPHRSRSVDENLDLLRRMRAGEFADGEHVLRAKIDMASPNMLMRDPLLYRIRHATHHRTGDTWCIYPMYDFAHCLEDSFEGITHSVCTLEFENNRALYDWVLDNADVDCHPQQIEFARLALDYVVVAKRKLRRLVDEGHVDGWDDPRMPTIRGLRRRGVSPEAIRALCEMVGVAKANSLVDIGKLEYCIRDDLNHRAPRVMCVLRPLEVVITNYPEGDTETIDAPYWPVDVPKEGSRGVPFSRTIYIERDDFREEPPKKWFRLAPGKEVRLRYAYVVKCENVVRDESGEIVRLECTYDPETRHGTPDGRRVKGTIHWVSAAESLPCEVHLYDRLFRVPMPGSDPDVDFVEELNPDALVTLTGSRVEPSVKDDDPGSRYQFERQGYFVSDTSDSAPDHLVFNRTVTLRDSWAKIAGTAKPPAARRERKSAPAPERDRGRERAEAHAADIALAARFALLRDTHGVDPDDADVLAADADVTAFFEAAVAKHPDGPSVANWTVNELMRVLKERPLSDLAFDGAALGALVALVDDGTITRAAGKEVFEALVAEGGDPAAIAEARGLRQVSSESDLEPVVDRVIAENPDEVERYRGGKTGLLGFFTGQVMKATGGNANPGAVRALLERKLGA